MHVPPAAIASNELPSDVIGLLTTMVRSSTPVNRTGPLPYQIELLESGRFRLTADFESTHSFVISDKSVLYFLSGGERFAVIATYLAKGFPLNGLIDARSRICYNIGDPNWGVRRDHLESFSAASREAPALTTQPIVPYVLTGDANFAHVVWNQLPALENALASIRSPIPKIVATHQPLGPLEKLVAGFDPAQIEHRVDFELTSLNGGNPKAFVPIAGELIPRSLRERLTRVFVRDAAREPARILAEIGDANAFVLTLRSQNRTAVNLIDTLTDLCHAALERFETLHIVLDGHSFAADLNSNRSYDVPSQTALAREQREMAAELRSRINERAQPRVHVAVGLDVRDSIAILSKASFYFAHHGTVQHKIGWFYECPGIVHSNPATLAIDPAQWVVDQVEDGVKPTYLPADYVEDAGARQYDDGSPLSEILATLHHENYAFETGSKRRRSCSECSRQSSNENVFF